MFVITGGPITVLRSLKSALTIFKNITSIVIYDGICYNFIK